MTTLPPSRQIIHGRTHGKTWSPADADPIRHYARGFDWPTAAYAAVCFAAAGFVGWLVYMGL